MASGVADVVEFRVGKDSPADSTLIDKILDSTLNLINGNSINGEGEDEHEEDEDEEDDDDDVRCS